MPSTTHDGKDGKARCEGPVPDSDGGRPTIPLTVRGRNGLQANKEGEFVWKVDAGAKKNYERLGERLATNDDLYRNGSDGLGLIQVLPNGKTRLIRKGAELAPILADRVSMVVTKNDKITSDTPPATHLNAMLRSEVFLSSFRAVDAVVRTPYYLDDFTLVQPGYHDGGPGKRILYVGPVPEIGDGMATITAFSDVMDYDTRADRTNAVAAALTTLLRHHWLGEKPLVLITATRSHAGKGTIAEFARGSVGKADILYESIDWPMQSQFQRQVTRDPDLGMITFDNVRRDSAGGRGTFIRSAFVESFVTNAEVTLASPGAGEAITLPNKYVVVINTNDGALSQDILNRALPIHLAPKGSIHERQSPIGNPKLEFLPQNLQRIEAELRGMIEQWRKAGCPQDETVKHSMTPWAKTVGGILKHNGFTNFLGNQQTRKAVDDPIRRAIGILGLSRKPGNALRPGEWAQIVVEQGLVKTVIPANERDTVESRSRALGVLLRPLVGDTFEAVTETKRYTLKLEGGPRRWVEGENPHVRYQFVVLEEEELTIEENKAFTENIATPDTMIKTQHIPPSGVFEDDPDSQATEAARLEQAEEMKRLKAKLATP
jgi:hypothetical protein